MLSTSARPPPAAPASVAACVLRLAAALPATEATGLGLLAPCAWSQVTHHADVRVTLSSQQALAVASMRAETYALPQELHHGTLARLAAQSLSLPAQQAAVLRAQ